MITLNRPEVGNAISAPMARELSDVGNLVNQDEAVRAVVITGAGGVFSQGTDPESSPRVSAAGAMASIGIPTIAAISGEASGAGLELALACDIRLGSETAVFSLPQITSGIIPEDGGTQRLPRLIGKARALEMLLLGEAIGAEEAHHKGLLSCVLPPGELLGAAMGLAEKIGQRAPIALKYAKEAVYRGLELSLEQGLRLEADLYALLQTTADRTEGIRAFQEKREPHFKGE